MRRREEGVVAIVVAVFAVVAFGFAAIVVDLGYARMVKARAQDAADSAALAAAAALVDGDNPSQAADQAKDNAEGILAGIDNNFDFNAMWGGCLDPGALPGPEHGCASFDDASDPRQVRVIILGLPAPSFFGGVFGYGGTTVSASAVASLGPVTFTPECAICVQSSEPQTVAGRVDTTEGADIAFAADAGVATGGAVRAEERTVFLGGDPTEGADLFDDTLIINAAPVDNPLATDEAPAVGDVRTDPCNNIDPTIGGPGLYGASELGSAAAPSCTLVAGDYVFTGPLTAAVNAEILGLGARIWVRDSLDFSAAASVILQEPADGSVVYASESEAVTIELFGASVVNIDGDINAPAGTLVGGGSCVLSTVGGLIVVGQLDVGSGQCIRSTATTARTIAGTEPPVLIS